MFVRRTGRGEPLLVFIHGLACDHSDWDAQVAHFGAAHACLAVDLPGHGRSPAADRPLGIERFVEEVVALVAPLGVPAVLCGHSMGCRLAIAAANRLGAQAVGVVAVDGSSFAAGDPESVRAASLARVEAAGFRASIEGLFRPMFTARSPAGLVERALARALSLDPKLGPGLLADMAAWDAAHSTASLDAVRVPMLAIQSTAVDANRKRTVLGPGDRSPWTDAVAARVPGARVELLPGIGHFTMIEAPERVNGLLASFLEELRPA